MVELEPNKKSEDTWWQPSLMLFFQLSGWIGAPIIIGVFLGGWLDKRYGTEPWLFLTTIGVSFVVSMVGIVREATKAIAQMEKLDKKKPKFKEENKDKDQDHD